MYIDTHAHLENNDETKDMLTKLYPNYVVVNGTDLKSNIDNLMLSTEFDNVFVAIGIHPENVDNISEDDYKYIEQNITNPKVVAIGEIGLDYYWRTDNKAKQIEVFKRQLDMAIKYNKPVVIHARNSNSEVYDILASYDNKLSIILHCYSGDEVITVKFLKLNVMFGVGGIITYKNANQLVNIINMIPIDRLLLETDSPYLAPTPHRGEKNSPLYIPFIAAKLAVIKSLEVNEILAITTENSIQKFDLPRQIWYSFITTWEVK